MQLSMLCSVCVVAKPSQIRSDLLIDLPVFVHQYFSHKLAYYPQPQDCSVALHTHSSPLSHHNYHERVVGSVEFFVSKNAITSYK